MNVQYQQRSVARRHTANIRSNAAAKNNHRPAYTCKNQNQNIINLKKRSIQVYKGKADVLENKVEMGFGLKRKEQFDNELRRSSRQNLFLGANVRKILASVYFGFLQNLKKNMHMKKKQRKRNELTDSKTQVINKF
jgi:hypothetical protein